MMAKDDLVRGRKRQRRKAPKTRSGCITCKIRHVKCDETKPNCNKCTSTGRKCDGYVHESTTDDASPTSKPPCYLAAAAASSEPTPINQEDGGIVNAETSGHADEELSLYEPSNDALALPLFPLGFPSSHLPGRAFHYFIHRSSVDLTGPLHSQVWREYVLSTCATSPAIQHAVIALSGFHERYCLPRNLSNDEQCWRQYYLAVRSANELVKVAARREQERTPAVTDEILLACAIFVTIEILLGNTKAALKHLESGLSLIQAYLKKGQDEVPPPPPQMDPLTLDLIGFFARLDMQVLSFSPTRHCSVSKPSIEAEYPPSQLSQPLPNAPSASLYRIMKHSLYWIRHRALAYKYSPEIPPSLFHTQANLLTALRDWKTTFLNGEDEDFIWIKDSAEPPPDRAHLLLSYHLTFLKLRTALSPTETIFSIPACLRSFSAILCYAFIILHQRNSRLHPVYLLPGKLQSEFFFSLESSIVEALYYTTLKCRHPTLRRCTLGMLKCAGTEGIWDGAVMARVAEHVIRLEEGDFHFYSSIFEPGSRYVPSNGMANCEFWGVWGIACGLNRKLLLGEDVDGRGNDGLEVPEERLVHTVEVDVDRETKSAEMECGWFVERERTWRHESNIVSWNGWPCRWYAGGFDRASRARAY